MRIINTYFIQTSRLNPSKDMYVLKMICYVPDFDKATNRSIQYILSYMFAEMHTPRPVDTSVQKHTYSLEKGQMLFFMEFSL